MSVGKFLSPPKLTNHVYQHLNITFILKKYSFSEYAFKISNITFKKLIGHLNTKKV